MDDRTLLNPLGTKTAPTVSVAEPTERTTSNIPTSPPIQLIYDCIGAGDKVEELPGRRARINRHNSVVVNTDGANRRQVIYTSKVQTATVELADIEKLVGKKKGATKIFTLALIKLCEQALMSGNLVQTTLHIGVNELVEQGFYSSPQTARVGFDGAMDILTSLKLQAEVKQGKNSSSTAKAVEVLFTGYERDNKGNCYIHLNERINWAVLAQYYTVIPNYYPRLSSNGLDLLHMIFSYARLPQNRESVAKNGYFTISLKAIHATLCLPNEEKTKNPERDIKAPIERAIEDIESQELGRGLLKFTPSVDGTEPIKKYLEGYVKVELTGDYSRKLEEITAGQQKQIQAREKRKKKIEDNARTLALVNKMSAED